MSGAERLLVDVDRWDGAGDVAQDAAIAELARALPAFAHVRTERFTGRQQRIHQEECTACDGMGGRSPQSGNTDYPDCDVCKNEHRLDVKTHSDPVSHRVAIFSHRTSSEEFVLAPGRLELAACLASRAPSSRPGFAALSPAHHRHLVTRAGVFDLAFETGTWPEQHPFGFVEAGSAAARIVVPLAALERAQSEAAEELADEVGPLDRFVPPGCVVRTGRGSAVPSLRAPMVLAFSRDGRWLAEAGMHDVRIFDVSTGRQLSRLALARPTDTQPLAIAFSPDSIRVVLASRHDVELYEVATGELLTRVGTGEVTWRSAAWLADGKLLLFEQASAGKLAVLRLVDPDTGETLRRNEQVARGPDAGVALATSLDGTRAVVSVHTGAIEVWDVPRWEVSARIATDQDGSLALGADHVFTSAGARAVHAFAITDGREHRLGDKPLPGYVAGAHGHRVVWWAWSEPVRVFDVRRGRTRRLSEHASATVAFSPDGARIATTVNDHAFVAIWPTPR